MSLPYEWSQAQKPWKIQNFPSTNSPLPPPVIDFVVIHQIFQGLSAQTAEGAASISQPEIFVV